MGGPQLEIFKFGLCLFFPIALMYTTGLPSFYEKHVLPTEEKWIRKDQFMKSVPNDKDEWKAYMDKAVEFRKKLKSEESI